jgi:hypothetical protein
MLMTLPGVSVLDAAFVLAVTGAAMIFPPAALIVGAGFFALSAFIADRRATPKEG